LRRRRAGGPPAVGVSPTGTRRHVTLGVLPPPPEGGRRGPRHVPPAHGPAPGATARPVVDRRVARRGAGRRPVGGARRRVDPSPRRWGAAAGGPVLLRRRRAAVVGGHGGGVWSAPPVELIRAGGGAEGRPSGASRPCINMGINIGGTNGPSGRAAGPVCPLGRRRARVAFAALTSTDGGG